MKKSLLAFILLIALAFSGCGGASTPPASQSQAAPESSAASQPASESASAEEAVADQPSDGLEGEVVYWSMWNATEPQGVVVAEAAKEFEAENPGTKINIVFNGRDNRDLVVPALESGQSIDLFDHTIDLILDPVSGWYDQLLPLDEYVDKAYPSTGGKTLAESLTPLYLNLAKNFSSDSKLYAIPYQPYLRAFMYNKDHFAQAGIEKVPGTWAELLDVCEKLKAAGFSPITTDDAYAYMNLGYHLCRYKGQKFVHDLVMGDESWDDPVVIQALKDYENLAAAGYFAPTVAANIWPAGQQEMAAGTSSMYVNGTFLVNELIPATGPEFPWGSFAYPAVEGGVEGTDANIFSSQCFAVSKGTQNPNLAIAFIAYMTTGKYDEKLSSDTYGIPMGTESGWPTQLLDAKGILDKTTIRYPGYTTIRDNADLQPVISTNFIKLIGGTITAEQFVDEIKKNQ